MEIIYSIVYLFRQFYRNNANFDLLYLFGIFLFVIYILRYRSKLFELIVIFMPFAISSIFVWLNTTHGYSLTNSIGYLCKIVICEALFIFIKYNSSKFNYVKFLKISMYLWAIMDLIALVFYSSDLWRHNDLNNDFSKTRLQLFFYEPSELSMCICLLLLIYLYKVRKKCSKKEKILFAGVIVFNIVFSAGIGGLIALIISIGFTIIYDNRRIICHGRCKIGFLFLGIGAVILLVFIIYSNLPLALRLKKILMLKDQSLYGRVVMPLLVLKGLLPDTHFWGIGLGNMDSKNGLALIYSYGMDNGTSGAIVQFPNSYLHLVGEIGFLGVIIILAQIVILWKNARKKEDLFYVALFFFIVSYQIMGGYYTNPLNWVCYGIIAATNVKEKYEEEKINTV